jgi:hypothetical protein
MDEAFPSCIPEPQTQRLTLLRALADSLEQAKSALATTTPAKLEFHSARQQELCRQLRSLATGTPAGGQPGTLTRLAEDVQETARRVADLNRKYAALLRRRRRTVDIFCRVLASSGTTYPAPNAVGTGDGLGAKLRG